MSAVGLAVVSALVRAAVASGLDVRTAILEVGRAVGRDEGAFLVSAAERLAAGRDWDAAWAGDGGRGAGSGPGGSVAPQVTFAPLARGLRPAWERGASPEGALRAMEAAHVAAATARAETAAAELGVRLALPVSLLLLPAFVVIGVVPLIVALVASVVGTGLGADMGGDMAP